MCTLRSTRDDVPSPVFVPPSKPQCKLPGGEPALTVRPVVTVGNAQHAQRKLLSTLGCYNVVRYDEDCCHEAGVASDGGKDEHTPLHGDQAALPYYRETVGQLHCHVEVELCSAAGVQRYMQLYLQKMQALAGRGADDQGTVGMHES